MRAFFESATKINGNIKHLHGYAEELNRYILHKQNSVMNEKEEATLDQKIDAVNDLFTKLSDKIRRDIKKNQSETLELKRSHENKELVGIRELHTFRQSRDLADVLRNYQTVQCDYRQREKHKLRETFLIANPDATEDDLAMLTDEVQGEALLASAFALGSHSARGILTQAKNRKKKIEKIVEMINTLVQLIEDIDKLVKKNTHVVDEISINITSAEEHTTQANRELSSALRYEMRAMRIKRILAMIVTLAIVGFLIYVFRDQIFNRSGNK
ncbi:hypothetical protein PAEPH01_1803 [Pancytospora epiphaga]|nr:hypothetical protein PAEPH01_1803 [Pancytospora epiphaga]